MTTFTRMLINPQKREGRKLLLNPQAMHAAIYGAFPPDVDIRSGRILWRVDSAEHTHTLYLVAPEAPDLAPLHEQAGWSTRPPQTADYSPLIDRIRIGQEWAFRFRGNPTHVVTDNNGRKRVTAHASARHEVAWFIRKASLHGFEMVGNSQEPDENVVVTSRGIQHFGKHDRKSSKRMNVTLHSVQFQGVLRVTDRGAFQEALVKGIGRGKAYGNGLLTIASTDR